MLKLEMNVPGIAILKGKGQTRKDKPFDKSPRYSGIQGLNTRILGPDEKATHFG